MSRRHNKHLTFSSVQQPFYFWFDIAIIAMSFFVLLFGWLNLMKEPLNNILLAIISLAGLAPVLISALKALIKKKLTIDLLAGIALIFALLAREWQSAVFVSLMLASARLFARYTASQAKNALAGLMKLRPTKIHLSVDGKICEVSIEQVKVGDLVVVESGERVAVDGVVESGEASIDQSSLTGESEPVAKKAGEEVLSSTLNVSGSLMVRAKKVGGDTTFAKILELVEKSQASKAPIASMVERFAGRYIFFTLLGATALYVFTQKIDLVLAVLLVTCADDLAVAIPLAFTAAIGVAARWGIIIKGGEFLEGLTKVRAMVFDKTGTITEGKTKVEETITFGGYSQDEFLAVLGAAESESGHPAAKAVKKLIAAKGINLLRITKVHEEPGFGIRGKIDGEEIIAGKTKFLKDNGIVFSDEESGLIEEQKAKNRMVTVLSRGGRVIGFVAMRDAVRAGAADIIKKLRSMGVDKIAMLTGDNEKIAAQVSQEVGITEWQANLLPKDKIEYLRKAVNADYKVAMVGDGVNDAAALALADLGIAMGVVGSDAAIESADVVLMKDKIGNIPEAMDLSRYALRIIKQDLWLWGAVNAVGLALVFGGVIGPRGAAAYNFLTDFLPLLNSLKLFRLHLRKKLP
ncbi:MAG: hypothetical protein COS30_02645 [Candidatus Portnoybacteria bacterium CG02_land_8_20_14_3_00_45_8]|uniref:P-type ATPase A domain-containing protein n=1 Tax=Candidatus Portnoybacteria bacterium CG02_land_8_20_14_3_00_45_8 TaxID=1974807 RepID=A0A2M7D5R5_9BACT|nr:MAG: hypothetical protein COS30_02645 [Candidatus Portnoybacteria bacterium CG02_land_8_20_14_3_00_45_8]